MNAPTEVKMHPAWLEAVLAVPMDDAAAPATTPSDEEQADEWVLQMLLECYN